MDIVHISGVDTVSNSVVVQYSGNLVEEAVLEAVREEHPDVECYIKRVKEPDTFGGLTQCGMVQVQLVEEGDNDLLILTRDDLFRSKRDLPLSEIGISDFRSFERKVMLKASVILFRDGDEQKEIKHRYRTW